MADRSPTVTVARTSRSLVVGVLVLVGGDLGEELRIRFDAEGLVGPELAVGRSGDRIESGSRLQAQASPERQAVMAGAAWWTNLFEHS